jgi:hypothetical protein
MFAKLVDKELTGDWWWIYVADIILWFSIGYFMGGIT